jgi:hypothetical protein
MKRPALVQIVCGALLIAMVAASFLSASNAGPQGIEA